MRNTGVRAGRREEGRKKLKEGEVRKCCYDGMKKMGRNCQKRGN